jgi:hypothetical protein
MPITEFNAGDKKRDARLRRKLLMVLALEAGHGPSSFVPARWLVDLTQGMLEGDARLQGFQTDDHAMGLIRSLVTLGYVIEKENDNPSELRRRGDEFSLDHCRFAISADGLKLYNDVLPPNPLIDDDRIPAGE